MKLVLLGTSGYFPGEQRHTSCIMLPEIGLLFDAGTGIMRLREYLQTDRLDVFLSHAHLDHVVGLTYLLGLLPPEMHSRVVVHGEAAKLDAVERHLFAEALFPLPPPFEFRPLGREISVGGGGVLRHFPLVHPGGAVGYRIDWPGRSLAYVTDTTASTHSAYLADIQGVDVLLHEAYFAHDAQFARTTGHSCLMEVVRLAAAAQVGRLVLTHLHPAPASHEQLDLAAARAVFPNTEIGTDRREISF